MAERDESSSDDLAKAWGYYEKIRESLTGLYDILSMSMDENNIFYQCAVDNLENLKDTILDLLKQDYNPKEIQKKLRDLEFNIKKNLFFEKDKEGME
ncbi:MAG: hypothetical protein EU533_00395 [Promethearchaeota archaeon]|nr:MAG: hypothetical protein EU533_00395 [Candidatus Lokiarchaeota archaeon]